VSSVADAYSAGAIAWADGPARVYGRLADALVAFSPTPLRGAAVLDLGSGTGVGTVAAQAAGARVIATDISWEMLRVERAQRPASAAGDALAAPFRTNAFDVVLAAFSLNHFEDPASAMREARRLAPRLLASTYASDDDHPVKHAVDVALTEQGWSAPEWYSNLKRAMQSWGTVDSASAAVTRAGLETVKVERLEVPFPGLTPQDLVAWRLGMAHTAPYVAGLDERAQRTVTDRALELLGPDAELLVRKVIFVAAT